MKKTLSIIVAIVVMATLSVGVFAEDAETVLYYYVDCGDPTTDTVSEGDALGIYQSVTDQFYGADASTGRTWGVVDESVYTDNATAEGDSRVETKWTWVNASESKLDSFRFCKDMKENGLDRVITYKFEVPNGTYEIEVGFSDPWWCAGLTTVTVDGGNSWVADAAGFWGGSATGTVTAEVTDGELDVVVTAVGGELDADGTQRQVDTICMTYITVSGAAVEEAPETEAPETDEPETDAPQTGFITAALMVVAIGSGAYILSRKH